MKSKAGRSAKGFWSCEVIRRSFSHSFFAAEGLRGRGRRGLILFSSLRPLLLRTLAANTWRVQRAMCEK